STTSATFQLDNDETVGAVTLVNATISGATLTGTSYNVQEGTISANLGGAAVALTKNATTVGGGTNIVTLTGTNTYTGTTTINAGALDLSVGGNAIDDAGAVILNTAGATLKLSHDETIGSLAGVSGTSVILDNSQLSTGDGSDTEFDGVISDTG